METSKEISTFGVEKLRSVDHQGSSGKNPQTFLYAGVQELRSLWLLRYGWRVKSVEPLTLGVLGCPSGAL